MYKILSIEYYFNVESFGMKMIGQTWVEYKDKHRFKLKYLTRYMKNHKSQINTIHRPQVAPFTNMV